MAAHVPFIANRVKVFFPFEPYDVQRQYVEKVIEALQGQHNALLESPTGTGKTLSLICSTLAWLQATNAKSTVYYTSRTHLQLSQAAKEMKRTAYSKVPAVVIGSRSKMCLNDEVRNQPESLINRSCRNAIAKNACAFHSNYEQKLGNVNPDDVHDIEDLLSQGKSHQFCPYYAAKKLAETKASVVFMPYNYLLDGALRKTHQLKLEQSVLIFDEAHNIESSLKDCVSGVFSLKGLDNIQKSCHMLPSKLSDALTREKHGLSRTGYDPSDRNAGVVDEFAKSKNGKPEKETKVNPIEELAEKLTMDRIRQIDEIVKLLRTETCKHMEMDRHGSIDKFFYLMKVSGVDYNTSNMVVETLDSMSSFWSIAGVMNPSLVACYVTALSQLSNVISLLYPASCLSVIRQQNNEVQLEKFYSCHLTAVSREATRVVREGDVIDWELHLWCLHPAIGLKKVIEERTINGPRSIIITSGTLAPTQSMIKELEIEVKVMKEFDHVISGSQLKIFTFDKAPNGYSLLSRFDDTRKEEYLNALGKTLLPLFQVLPYGTLVIMPSYGLMDKVLKYWKDKSTIWRDMNAATTVFVEARTSQENFNRDLAAYRNKISSPGLNNKAVFFGVCRGKLSEGTNLEGNHCRSVIVTGLPFPSLTDPRIESTKNFHNKYALATNQLDPRNAGQRWYRNQMLRALNQTIGRVIRSKNDFGMLFLCDPRFMQFRHSMSKWVWEYFPQQASRVECIQDEIKQFFSEHGITISDTASDRCGAFDIDLAAITSNPANWSPFSSFDASSSGRSSQHTAGSQPNNSNNRSIREINTPQSNEAPPTALERREAMIASYTVDRETITAAKNRLRRLPDENNKQTEKIKKFKSTTDYLESIYNANLNNNGKSDQPKTLVSTSSNAHPTTGSNGTVQTDVSQFSIYNQAGNSEGSGSYQCQICKHKAEQPFRTNCKCARVGCRSCILKILDKKDCAACGTLLCIKKMKQLLFDSAIGKEKVPSKKAAINIFKKR